VIDKSARPGEFQIIERFFRPLATDPGAFALTDDAALYRPRAGEELVLTSDMVVEGVHFLATETDASSIAKKALRVNLSDLAAKGAEPFGYLLSLALPAEWRAPWVKKFADGLAEDQERYGVTLLGGDLSRASGGATISITALGRVPRGRMVMRSGARPGDLVFVTGTIGDSALGLAWRDTRGLRAKAVKLLWGRYLRPEPRVELAAVLRRYATSAIDVSDGLVGDLGHICDVSGVAAEIEAEAIPLSDAARTFLRSDPSAFALILNGGDDYEILATVQAKSADRFHRAAEAAGVAVTRIGRVLKGEGPPVVRDAKGRPIDVPAASYTHF